MRRRALLAGVSALPFAAIGCAWTAPDGAAAEAAMDAFVDASCKLAGTGDMPRFFIAGARIVLEREFGAERLDALVRAVGHWSGDGPLPAEVETAAQRLLVILYTGETKEQPGRADAPYYPWALAWQTLDFASGPGLCRGGFGAWTSA